MERIQAVPLKIVAFALLLIAVRASFPENVEPLSHLDLEDIASKIFSGDDDPGDHRLRNVQLIKNTRIMGREKVIIAARENLFLIDPQKFSLSRLDDITYDAVVTWKSEKRSHDLCMMKGQPEELCYNFISVVEPLDQSGNRFLICGSDSFSPKCTNYKAITTKNGRMTLIPEGSDYTSGKQRCPFGPNQQSASLFTDGSLYSGTFQAFSGGSPVISRTMGASTTLRTSNSPNTMNEPRFVSMVDGDDRVFIYFNEIQKFPTGERRIVPQVAQVCKNDVGGERVLQGMWTTFLKSRLNCSYNGFYIDELRDVTKPVLVNGQAVVYATFATPENSLSGSAVCSFALDAMKNAMQGPFVADVKLPSLSVTPPAPSRHPGSCPTERPNDSELRFIKSYPQMQKQVGGSLLMTSQGVRHSAIAVDTLAGPYNVTMFYLGTDAGHVIRRLAPTLKMPRGAVVSDQDVFHSERCSSVIPSSGDRKIIRLMVDERTKSLTVVFKHCTVTLPLRMCNVYECKSACIGSADPYCGWNGQQCANFDYPQADMEQNIEQAVTQPDLYTECEPQQPSVVPTTTTATTKKTTTTSESDGSEKGTDSEDGRKDAVVGGGDADDATFTLDILVIAVILTFIFTIIVMLVLFVICRKYAFCVGSSVENSDDAFKKKQLEQQRIYLEGQEKRGSLGRKAHQTYRGCLAWLCQAPKPTPAPTPQVTNKTDHSLSRRPQNNYTEAPTLQLRKESAQRARMSSARHNSTSSTISNQTAPVRVTRKDSVLSRASQRMSVHQPLLGNSMNNETYEQVVLCTDTVPSVGFTQVSTLMRQHRRASHASGSSGGSTPSSSGPSHNGAELPQTASAKMRRRSERASIQTNEIMRDSDTAIRDFEATLQHMQLAGCYVPAVNQVQQEDAMARNRLDSNDSGKGESPRNSIRTETEQTVANITRQPRPNSLNLQRPPSQRRQRLLSEPADLAVPAFLPHPSAFQRFQSVQPHTPSSHCGSSCMSQSSTPVGGYPPSQLAVFQPPPHDMEQSIYATMPKNDATASKRSRQRNNSGGMYQQVYVQRPTPSDQRRGVWQSESPPRHPLNRYPSLQVRGPYANKPTAVFVPQPNVSATPPKNHYPSLPHRSSSAPYGSGVANGNGFERPATLHRREKLPSIMRQQAVPGVTPSKAMYVSPPTVPASICEQQPV